jgi:tetratricopeptide (TPR) repeat protein
LLENNYASSLEYFEKAKKLDSTNFHYPSAEATLYIRKYILSHNRLYLDLARNNLEEATRLSPQYAKTYQILSDIAHEMGEENKSKEYANQAKKLSPLKYSH